MPILETIYETVKIVLVCLPIIFLRNSQFICKGVLNFVIQNTNKTHDFLKLKILKLKGVCLGVC